MGAALRCRHSWGERPGRDNKPTLATHGAPEINREMPPRGRPGIPARRASLRGHRPPPPHLPLRVDGLRQVRGGGDAGPERRVHHARTSLRVPARGKRSLVLGGKGLGLAEKRPPAGSPSSPGARPNLDLDQTHVRTVCFFLKKPQYRRIRKWKSSGLEAPTVDLKKLSTRASVLAHITSQGKVSITLRRTGRDDRN